MSSMAALIVVLPILYMFESVESKSLNVTSIRFFVHLPYTDSAYSYETLGAVIDIAFIHINRKYQGSGLQFIQYRQIYPSIYRCDQTLSVIGQLGAKYYYDFIEVDHDAIPAFFVAACDPVMNFIGDYAREVNALFVTSIPADMGLENKIRFPTLTRFIPYQPQDIAGCISALLTEFSWHRISLIHETSTTFYSTTGFTIYDTLVRDKEFTPTYFLYDTASDADDWKDPEIFLESAKSFTRVIILMVPMPEVRKLLVTAHRNGMTNGEFVFVTIWPSRHDHYGNSSWQRFDENDHIVHKAFQSLLVVSPRTSAASTWAKNFTTPSNSDRIIFSPEEGGNCQEDLHVLDTYSALTEAADAYFAIWNNSGDIRNGEAVSKSMWNKTLRNEFADETFIDPNGDKKVQYSVLYFNNKSGQFEEIFIFDACTTTWSRQPGKTIAWPGGKRPLDEPICGYSGNKPECSPSGGNLAVIVWIPVTGLLLVSSIVIHIYTRRKFRHESDLETSWKLEENKLLVPFHIRGRNWLSQYSASQALISNATMVHADSVIPKGHIGFYEKRKIWIKCIDVTRPYHPDIQEKVLLREYVRLSHPNIVPFLGLVSGFLCVKLITDYRKRGSLRDILDNKTTKLDAWLKSSFVNHLVSGLAVLHGSVISRHGNLKSTNCLIDNYFVLQLADVQIFPSSVCEPPLNDYSTMLWKAPEALRCEEGYVNSKLTDMFSFGIVAQEIYTESRPYQCNDTPVSEPFCKEIVESLKSISLPPFRWDEWKNCSDFIRVLVTTCCAEEPEERFTTHEVRTYLNRYGEFRHGKSLMDDILDRMAKYAIELEEAVGLKTDAFLDEKRNCEHLLLNIFPEVVARALMGGNAVYPERYDSVTICFTGIDNFPALSVVLAPNQIVRFLNDLYTIFDAKISNFDVYKVETVADSYVVASGLPVRNGNEHVRQVALLAKTLVFIGQHFRSASCQNERVGLKIGFNTGPVATAVVGIRRPRYCIFGDAMNTASRMMSTGEALRIHVSKPSKECLANFGIECEFRGSIHIKGKGKEETFWLKITE